MTGHELPNAGRVCGRCTMCCKLMSVDELDKPADVWCLHCTVGTGCRIYADRPPTCRGFLCGYLAIDGIPEHWFPAKCKMVIQGDGPDRTVIRVDKAKPGAWRAEPYYTDLKRTAAQGGSKHQLLIYDGGRTWAMTPFADIDLGFVTDAHVLVTVEEPGRGGRWAVEKLPASDPRVANLKVGEWVQGKL